MLAPQQVWMQATVKSRVLEHSGVGLTTAAMLASSTAAIVRLQLGYWVSLI